MTTCPKCGFKNDQTNPVSCPKCGIVYEKVLKAHREEVRHLSAEKALKSSLNRAMTGRTEATSGYSDFEPGKDRESYKLVENLSLFFYGIAGIIAIVLLLNIKFFWSLMGEMNASFNLLANQEIFSSSDKLLIIIGLAVGGLLQVGICMAIGVFLKFGKDIADNTRATRNYLAEIARRQ